MLLTLTGLLPAAAGADEATTGTMVWVVCIELAGQDDTSGPQLVMMIFLVLWTVSSTTGAEVTGVEAASEAGDCWTWSCPSPIWLTGCMAARTAPAEKAAMANE